MDKAHKERRKHLRIYRNFILHCHEKGKAKSRHEISQVNNISRGGLNFSSSRALKTGAVVIIELQAPFIAGPLHLEGVVLECKEKIGDIIFEIRLQFQGLTPGALAMLERVENYGKTEEQEPESARPETKG